MAKKIIRINIGFIILLIGFALLFAKKDVFSIAGGILGIIGLPLILFEKIQLSDGEEYLGELDETTLTHTEEQYNLDAAMSTETLDIEEETTTADNNAGLADLEIEETTDNFSDSDLDLPVSETTEDYSSTAENVGSDFDSSELDNISLTTDDLSDLKIEDTTSEIESEMSTDIDKIDISSDATSAEKSDDIDISKSLEDIELPADLTNAIDEDMDKLLAETEKITEKIDSTAEMSDTLSKTETDKLMDNLPAIEEVSGNLEDIDAFLKKTESELSTTNLPADLNTLDTTGADAADISLDNLDAELAKLGLDNDDELLGDINKTLAAEEPVETTVKETTADNTEITTDALANIDKELADLDINAVLQSNENKDEIIDEYKSIILDSDTKNIEQSNIDLKNTTTATQNFDEVSISNEIEKENKIDANLITAADQISQEINLPADKTETKIEEAAGSTPTVKEQLTKSKSDAKSSSKKIEKNDLLELLAEADDDLNADIDEIDEILNKSDDASEFEMLANKPKIEVSEETKKIENEVLKILNL